MSLRDDIAGLTIPAIREGLLNKKFSATEIAREAVEFALAENPSMSLLRCWQ